MLIIFAETVGKLIPNARDISALESGPVVLNRLNIWVLFMVLSSSGLAAFIGKPPIL